MMPYPAEVSSMQIHMRITNAVLGPSCVRAGGRKEGVEGREGQGGRRAVVSGR